MDAGGRLAFTQGIGLYPTLDFGDGQTKVVYALACLGGSGGVGCWFTGEQHTYQTAGTYTVKFLGTAGGTVLAQTTVTVTGSTGGTPSGTLTATPSSGTAPLAVAVKGSGIDIQSKNYFFLDFGDGQQTYVPSIKCFIDTGCFFGYPEGFPHTYQNPGTYTVKFMGNTSNVFGGIVLAQTTMTVTGSTASVQNSSQLANALVALESALKALLELLK